MTARKKPAPSLRDYLLLAEMDRADAMREQRDRALYLLAIVRPLLIPHVHRFPDNDYTLAVMNIDALLAEVGVKKGDRK